MVDTIALVDDDLVERISLSNAGKTFLLLEQGSKTEASSISTHCGGGAINAAISLKRLGFDVSVLAKVGQDQRADMLRQRLKAEGIETSALRLSANAPSGASAIIASHDRNAAVFTFRGANTMLSAADLKFGMTAAADLVYVSTLSGESADLLPQIVRLARHHGAFITVNPGIRQITTRFRLIHQVLEGVDVVAVNRLEAEALVRQAVAELAGSENQVLRRMAAASLPVVGNASSAPRHEQVRALIHGIRHLGARTVLITDGRSGAYAGTDDEIVFCPAVDATVVSTIGAGDAFVSTFTGYRKLGAAVADALRAAMLNAASVVTFADAQTGLLTKADINKRMRKANGKVGLKHWAAVS